MTYYELLEISENASEEVIHMAYKALVKKYHPDVYIGDKSFAEEKMKAINEAYSVLSDSDKRSAYDSFLKSKKTEQNSSEQEEQPKAQTRKQPEKVKKGGFKKWILLVGALFIGVLLILPLTAISDIETVKDSVVMIKALDANDNVIATGSGFCAFGEDYIVTNYHVIEGASKLDFVSDDGMKHTISDVLIFSKDTDLAILKSMTELKPIPIGNADKLNAGDKVTAIGSPEEVLNTVSTGIVSNADDDYEIRTTAPISPGSSGGVLLNEKNKVIGITYVSYDSDKAQNINYAINVYYLKHLYDCLKKDNFELITKDNVDDYRTKLEDDETAELIYYGVDSVETLGLLTEEKFEDTLIYTDVVGQKYDLNGVGDCVIVRTITIEDEYWADLIFTSMKKEGFYEENGFNKVFQEKDVIRIMDENGAEQGGGIGRIVTPGMYVDEVDEWCFDSRRKVGDMAMIENEYGYTLCYISFIYEG